MIWQVLMITGILFTRLKHFLVFRSCCQHLLKRAELYIRRKQCFARFSQCWLNTRKCFKLVNKFLVIHNLSRSLNLAFPPHLGWCEKNYWSDLLEIFLWVIGVPRVTYNKTAIIWQKLGVPKVWSFESLYFGCQASINLSIGSNTPVIWPSADNIKA